MFSEYLRAVEHIYYTVVIHVHGIAERFTRSDTVCVVLEVYGLAVKVLKVHELSALPSENIVAYRRRITDRIVGYRRAVIVCQQVLPRAVAVGIAEGIEHAAEGAGGVNFYSAITDLLEDASHLLS